MSKQLPFYKMYVADAETDENFRMLEDAELGFYWRCLNHSWVNGGLPADPDKRARALRTPREMADKLWQMVQCCFVLSEDGTRYLNDRQERERADAISKSECNTKAVRSRYERKSNVATDGVRTKNERKSNVAIRASESESVSESLEVNQEDKEKVFVMPVPVPAGVTSESMEKVRELFESTSKPLNDEDWIAFAHEVASQPEMNDAAMRSDVIPFIESQLFDWNKATNPSFIPFPASFMKKKAWTRKAKAPSSSLFSDYPPAPRYERQPGEHGL